MRIKYLFIASIAVLLLVSCVTTSMNYSYKKLEYKKISNSDREYIFQGVENCSNLYTDGELSVLEVYCSTESDGLYIYGKNYNAKFDWYDKEFNLWAISEGCNNKDVCFYELKVDKSGVVQGFRYYFYINLSEGFYEVRVIDKKLKVIGQKITDHPS